MFIKDGVVVILGEIKLYQNYDPLQIIFSSYYATLILFVIGHEGTEL